MGEVLVTPRETLLGICVENLGSCTPEILQQIHELNPSLSNPDPHLGWSENSPPGGGPMSWFRALLGRCRVESLESQQMPVECGSIESAQTSRGKK